MKTLIVTYTCTDVVHLISMWLIDLLFVLPTNYKEVVFYLLLSHYKCD